MEVKFKRQNRSPSVGFYLSLISSINFKHLCKKSPPQQMSIIDALVHIVYIAFLESQAINELFLSTLEIRPKLS